MLDNLEGIEGSNVKLCLWGSHRGRFGDSSPQEGPQTEQGHGVGKEQGRWRVMTRPQLSIPISLGSWGGAGRVGSEAEPGEKVGLVFISHCLTAVLICSKLNYLFPKLSLFSHDSDW